MNDSLGGVTQYDYDGADRVTAITTPWGGVISQSYDAAGRPARMTLPNGLDADQSYESATGRLAAIAHRAGSLAAPIARYDHSYDVRGNLAAVNELAGSKSFTYDAVERLTAVTQTTPAPAKEAESYAYDPEGNRIVTHLSPAYVTDDADRVLDDGINSYKRRWRAGRAYRKEQWAGDLFPQRGLFRPAQPALPDARQYAPQHGLSRLCRNPI